MRESPRRVSVNVNKLGTLDEFTDTVRQLNSNQKLPTENTTFQHPWAMKPSSVAAQGAINLAARLRKSKDSALRDSYFKAGCIDPLLKILSEGKEAEKVHASIIALLALTESSTNPDISQSLVEKDAMSILPKLMANSLQVEGVRMSSATIARNIIGSNQKYKTEFVNNGGLRALVSLIDFDTSRVREEVYTQWILERVNDIRDYVEYDGGKIDESVAKKLVNENVRAKLMKLKSASQDNDIIEDSVDVLTLLTNY